MAISKTFTAQASGFALALALLQPAAAFAQDQAAQDETLAQDEAPSAEEIATEAEAEGGAIIVTGTSIRGEPPVGSSLIALGRAEIESTPSVTTTQIIREVPQIFNFGVTDSARNQSGGAGNIAYGNSINIRGIGPFATLTLINGRRPAPQGTLGASVDPGTIPAIALERVEIIADGASAVYGSDAVAGVANLILRRRFDGLGADVQYGWGDDYHDFNASAIVGHDWGSGRFTLAGQHNYRSNLSGLDRDFYQADLRPFGGADSRVNQCNPGTVSITTGGVTRLFPIPAGGATPTNLVQGAANLCDNVKATDLLPEQEINSATFTFDQDLSDTIHFFADGLYSKRDGFRRSAPAVATLVVPNTNAFFVAPAGATLATCPASAGVPATARCESILFSFGGLVPNTLTDIVSEVYQATGGLDIELSDNWNMNAYVTGGYDHDHVFSRGNGTDPANLAAALRSSDPTMALNPFGTAGGNSPAVIAAVFDNLTDTDGKTRFADAGIKFDGSLFTLPGGDVKLAVGGEWNSLKLRTGQIRGRRGAQTGTDQQLRRSVKSAYVEVLIPIFGEDNRTAGFHSLDLDIAGRIDDYSDVGSTKNPKIGINWEPIEDLKFHASYGESFRAPLLTNLVSAGGSQLFLQNYFDPTANNGAGANVEGIALSGGNLDLSPETARTYSFGADYNPSWLPGAQLTLNYFNLKYEGQIVSYLSNLNVLRQETLFSSIILRGAAGQARVAELIASGRPIANGRSVADALAAGNRAFVDGRTNNLGLTKTHGLDFGISVPFDLGSVGRLKATLRGTRFFNYKVALTPGGQIIDQLNNIDFPLRFRARAGLALTRGELDVNLFANYQNAYNNTFSTLRPRIDSYTTVDGSISYDFGEILPVARKLRLGVSALNVFDEDPPFADLAANNNGGGGFDPTSASPIGRVVSVFVRSEF